MRKEHRGSYRLNLNFPPFYLANPLYFKDVHNFCNVLPNVMAESEEGTDFL